MRTFSMIAVSLVLTGCGGVSAPPKTVPVTGIVTHKGEPLASGKVTLHPGGTAVKGSPQRPAIGEIQPGGNFELSTFVSGDGAIPGDYKVTVESYDQEITMEEFNEGKRQTSTIPEKYRATQTSGLTASIPDQSSPFELKLDLVD